MNTEMNNHDEWNDDPLKAARGCLLALLYSAGIWSVIILLACWLWS